MDSGWLNIAGADAGGVVRSTDLWLAETSLEIVCTYREQD